MSVSVHIGPDQVRIRIPVFQDHMGDPLADDQRVSLRTEIDPVRYRHFREGDVRKFTVDLQQAAVSGDLDQDLSLRERVLFFKGRGLFSLLVFVYFSRFFYFVWSLCPLCAEQVSVTSRGIPAKLSAHHLEAAGSAQVRQDFKAHLFGAQVLDFHDPGSGLCPKGGGHGRTHDRRAVSGRICHHDSEVHR
ncbi:MAG: hypothetical protein E7237_07270 [Sarcina sp.]|nr:hypothetical protein [Sarcina sp.]